MIIELVCLACVLVHAVCGVAHLLKPVDVRVVQNIKTTIS